MGLLLDRVVQGPVADEGDADDEEEDEEKRGQPEDPDEGEEDHLDEEHDAAREERHFQGVGEPYLESPEPWEEAGEEAGEGEARKRAG